MTFNDEGYTVTSDRAYGMSMILSWKNHTNLIDVGEEIYVSYGAHENDFLLVECMIWLLLHEDSKELTLR